MRSTPNRAAPGLILAARQLRNDRLVRLFESFLEYRACVGRVIVQSIVTAWCLGWLYGPQPVLVADAHHVFPTAVGLCVLSVVWMLLVRRRVIAPSEWLDAMGFAMNLLFIGIQTYLAFILLMSLNAFLPFITIAAVARYGQRAIFPVLLSTFVLMLLTAPSGYWLSRPAYFVYAVALIIVLPLLVARIVLAMQEVALQALASRDAQSRFISTMSHELRTPLNAVINCAQLIETEQMPAQQRELLQSVTVNATALRHRVNEVLDVASIDGGRLQLHRKPLNLLDVVTTVKAVCADAASSKGVTLDVRVDSPQAPHVMGDEGRIEQVISNLVINAIKFTPAGGTVDLLIDATQVQERWSIAVTVTDTGIGVPDDQKAYIFTPFTQLSTGFSRVEGGVGLGLYIALSVSDAMGGSLTVSDNPAGGSIFRWIFELPGAAAGSNTLALRDALAQHAQNVPSLHCLVFEDMDTNRLVIGNLLTRAGHRVSFQVDGTDAVQRIREAAPDLVFLDLHMPGTSGWDALREARDAMSALPPIIVLTADTRTDSMRDASAAGVAGYLPKPINAHELLALLAQHASHARP
ncbi:MULTISPECIES: ATP-binding response regulator [Xanthomonas]|uniref:ATP-binding response regulator n=1 Tax=Xanthomonas TaxID=338 RepID=UPI001ADBCD93|nr:ATP-binding protein [Xanthomonas phaseoli]MBO9766940.1 response regulator [Xanthomonas phaseoli pv. dieffenbachiae]MBO9777583.1 response regulator [Xanthomonas phaseoli pv. dieffenbachiae]MBO9778498.1 response regulator [Xanthomonas phaseoli pv. dieffenbachiae]MBO9794778.1 response regulator [Xanthomonas phaseoli pv. dieffenbachiae]MBO9800596.1 response regulator [Xanthomonas phaseoli pv. dieffenbachiae]